MVMSDKTAIVQLLKISRIMILINIGGSRGGGGGDISGTQMWNDVHLPRIWTGNALKTGKMT